MGPICPGLVRLMKELDLRLGSEVKHDQGMMRPSQLNVHNSHQELHERFIPPDHTCLKMP